MPSPMLQSNEAASNIDLFNNLIPLAMMNKNVYVFLATGFEEIEAVATIDLLRRAGLSCVIVSVEETLNVSGAHNVCVCADKHISQVSINEAEAIILPGGLPGVTNLNDCAQLRELVASAQQSGILVAAICAAPMILGQLGILEGKRATTYPSFEPHLKGYIPSAQGVQIDGSVITATSAGFTFDFALAIITHLLGEEAAASVASGIIYSPRH